MTYDELMNRIIELADESLEVLDDLQFRDSEWNSWGIDEAIGGMKHAKAKANRILHSRETYKLEMMKQSGSDK